MKKNTVSLILLIIGFSMIILGIVVSVMEKPKTLPIIEEEKKELTDKKINKLKKEIINTASSYIADVTFKVNNLDYDFTGENTIYAVPIECIELNKAKDNLLGMWKPVSDDYWAYVLVQYDDDTSSYTYGFTFKDSEGYGMYPISVIKLLEDGSQIQKDLELFKPKTGLVTEITSIKNWGERNFMINEETKLVVLESRKKGNNIDTCTIR